MTSLTKHLVLAQNEIHDYIIQKHHRNVTEKFFLAQETIFFQ